MFRQGLLVICSIILVSIVSLLLAGYLYAKKGKEELAAIQGEIRQAGGKLEFKDFGLSPGEKTSEGYLKLNKELSYLKEHFSEARDASGHTFRKSETIGLEYSVIGTAPQDWNFNEGISWEQLRAIYAPVRSSWEQCIAVLDAETVIYQNNYSAGAEIEFLNLNTVLDVCKIGAILSFLEILRGDLARATRYIEESKRINKKLIPPESCTLIEFLVSITEDEIMMVPARQILSHPDLRVSELNVLAEIWEAPDALKGFSRSIAGERVIFQTPIFDAAEDNADTLLHIMMLADYRQNGHPWFLIPQAYLRYIYVPFLLDKDRAHGTKILWDAQLAAELTINGSQGFELSSKKFRAGVSDLKEENLFYQLLKPFSRLMVPGMVLAADKAVLSETRQRQMVIALELARHKLEQDQYPESLPKKFILVEHGWTDPMTLEPMKYVLQNDGSYVLYSVGLDGTDDGGEFVSSTERDENGDRYRNHTAPDWIWPKVVSEQK